MFDRNETQRDDALQGLFDEIGEGMAPPAALVRAVKGGVYLNPAAKRGTHVWRFAKAVVGYALGVMLFLGAILLLPKLWEGGEPTVGTPMPSETTDSPSPSDPSEALKAEIIAAYARQFGKDEEKLSVQIVGRYGDVCAVYVYEEGAYYPDEDTLTHGGRIEDVYGLEFSYLHTPVLLIYRPGDKFYSLSDAAEQGVIPKESVRELYITHSFAALDFKQKVYCTATLQDKFSDNQIFVTVFPEFNEYPYTAADFTEIGCVKVEEVAGVGEIGQNGETVQNKLLLLTLDKQSKENVLSAIKRLEVELDVYTAGPYGYEKAPEEKPPVTEPTPPVTQPAEEPEYCLKKFKSELNKNIVLDRLLTGAEIDRVRAFLSQKDANLALACTYVPFSDAHKISLYELMYASDIKQEFPGNPYQNDGSMMTVSRIREVVLQYMGIYVTRDMLDQLVADGAEYFPDLDAYGFPHTDCSGFVPVDPIYGYLLEDGRWLIHLCLFDAEGDHVMVLLQPRTGGFWIDAGMQVRKRDIPDAPTTPVVPSEPVNIEGEIARAYADRYGKDVHKLSVRIVARDPWAEQKYYAVFVDDRDVVYANKLMLEEVDGLFFRYNTTQTLLIYSKGAFYSVSEAFSQNVMNRSEISDLHSRYEEKYSDLFDADDLRQFAEMEIKQLCPQRFGMGEAEDYSVRFVMTVGKGCIVYIDGPISVTDKATTQKICGLEFIYPTSQVMEFYRDGKFYSLPEAFESGLLHYMTIHWLYARHNPEVTEEVIGAHVATDEDCPTERDHKVRFVAKMGDRYAVFIDCPGVMYPQEEITVTINGLDFWYSDYHQMEIYHNGSFYSVHSAFGKGILSENQLRYLYEIRNGNYDYPYAE